MSNKIRSIEKVMPPPPAHMVGDGFRVHNFFPGPEIGKKRMSPFYLLDYNAEMEFSPSDHSRGVGVHPHRGFETVTIAYKGKIAHHDSAGHSGVIGAGDVQWMTAASGVLHKEYHEENFSKEGGPFQMVQLWVNLPAKYKMSEPKYQEITQDKMGKYQLENNAGTIEVIAGNYLGTKGAATTFTPIEAYNAYLKQDTHVKFEFPSGFNTGMLVVQGEVEINGSVVSADHFVLFRNEDGIIEVKSITESKILILSGEPIDEPIAQYGPFLMNKWEELEQAISDVSAGKFGVLEG